MARCLAPLVASLASAGEKGQHRWAVPRASRPVLLICRTLASFQPSFPSAAGSVNLCWSAAQTPSSKCLCSCLGQPSDFRCLPALRNSFPRASLSQTLTIAGVDQTRLSVACLPGLPPQPPSPLLSPACATPAPLSQQAPGEAAWSPGLHCFYQQRLFSAH